MKKRTVKNKYSFVILDIETGDAKEFEEQCKVYAPFRNENKALLCNGDEYRLVDLGSGETFWSMTYIHNNYPNSKVTFLGAAVVENGSSAVLLSKLSGGVVTVHLISMEDGSELNCYVVEKTSGQLAFGDLHLQLRERPGRLRMCWSQQFRRRRRQPLLASQLNSSMIRQEDMQMSAEEIIRPARKNET